MDLSGAGSVLAREDFLVIDIERFQGPLDLLLHLIRQQDIDIFDIPIATITRQFLSAVHGIHAEDLDNAGEFLEMAAMLIRVKAQMLLPRTQEGQEEDPRAELVRRLLEYEQIREISHRLAASQAEQARRFGKGYVEPRARPAMEDTPLETTWEEVFEVALEITPPRPGMREHVVTTRPVAMEDKMNLILGTLDRVPRIEFRRLVEPFKNRIHGVMTFLAGLELTRRRRVKLRQVKPFAELWVYRGVGAEEEWDEGTEARREEGSEALAPEHSEEQGEVS